jgi:hypothetical protein
MARGPLEKKLSYRLPVNAGNEDATLASMAAHWEGFEWVSGPVMVFWTSKQWGEVQVWAISELEGRGVIEHALAHMGAPQDAGTWRTATVSNPRFGRVGTVRATIVSARSGSGGAAPHRYLDGPAS